MTQYSGSSIDLSQFLYTDVWVLAYLPGLLDGNLNQYINIVHLDDKYVYFVAIDSEVIDSMLEGGELNDYEADDINAAIIISQNQTRLSENVLLSFIQDGLVHRMSHDIKVTIYPDDIYSTADIEELLNQCQVFDTSIEEDEE